MTARACATCRWFAKGAPALAAATLNATTKPGVGTCQLYAPVLAETRWFPVSMFPEVHAERWCGDWQEGDDPDDGERAAVPAEVVPIRSVAA